MVRELQLVNIQLKVGGKGIKTANVTEKNGPIAGLTVVDGEEDIMLITDKGVMIRFESTVSHKLVVPHLVLD